ncbi:sulfatase [Luteimonas sp. RD2P54]|uniref:Sulfatase n=1 Tax=Luteimonas endophytica TaxID=3042023 RepID=A0ABT6J614_9GAMM|nr:sulfatase [Luteimonas endophytica]MDH5821648.1 sulfatase [Luteimonas endophytica]
MRHSASGRRLALAFATLLLLALTAPAAAQRDAPPRNVVFILSDDHRHDFMGFVPGAPEWLETPSLDRMAAAGAHVENAFVTTALCSPSRASILTGQYAHRHEIVDNSSPIPAGTRFFPEFLQRAGYRTAYVGKWHMGEVDDAPQPGFDHWVSFQGQGVYENPVLNVNGRRVRAEGYTTDLLTGHALDWLKRHRAREPETPFFLYLSHKAVHAEFEPAPRHRGRHAGRPIPYPPTMPAAENRAKPDWVRAQRDSWHGVDYLYHGQMEFDGFYRAYTETLLALDESVGRVLDYLEETGLADSTLVIYMGDNGFLLGEHGLIDKRNAYEESMRVPMLAWAPGFIAPGSKIGAMVRNIDIAPTLLELAGAAAPIVMDGRSVLPLLRGAPADWPLEMLYEYYWEDAFPHTPTVFALRDQRYKYIYYHGVWDSAELYDLQADPQERSNLIRDPAQRDRAAAMKARMWALLRETDGMRIPLKPAGEWRADQRRPE